MVRCLNTSAHTLALSSEAVRLLLHTHTVKNEILNDLLKEGNISQDEITEVLQDVVQKSLYLNKQLRIRHGDFHGDNIVYKNDLETGKRKFAFIDFELSTEYDKNENVMHTGLPKDETEDSYFRFNPYYDLIQLENGLFSPDYYLDINLPPDARLHYLQGLTEPDLEMIEETIADRKEKIPIVFNINGKK